VVHGASRTRFASRQTARPRRPLVIARLDLSPRCIISTVTRCNTLQHAATCCNTQQHTAKAPSYDSTSGPVGTVCYLRCNTLQHAATCCNTWRRCSRAIARGLVGTVCHLHCNALQHATTHCNTLQHPAKHTKMFCNKLQHTAIARLAL